ncbi:MAG: response regulator [Polyangiaceae bacterium]
MKQKHRVLVVDDERLVLGAMQRILRRYEVTVSESLAEARYALEAGSFDAVVSDVELRDGTGIELFEEVQARHPEQAERFVFVSGAADVPTVRALLERTRRPYLRKPFEVFRLLELVASAIEGRRSDKL